MVSTMPVTQDVSLVVALEDLVVFVRRLPAEPDIGATAAAALRACALERPQRISELTERLGVSQPAVTQLVDRMVAEGWAARTADPADRRVVQVHATDLGREVLERRRASRARLLDDLVTRLDDDDQRRLREALPVLHRLAHVTREPSLG
jgi:DNA-binding MarR family transcriptional regulator